MTALNISVAVLADFTAEESSLKPLTAADTVVTAFCVSIAVAMPVSPPITRLECSQKNFTPSIRIGSDPLANFAPVSTRSPRASPISSNSSLRSPSLISLVSSLKSSEPFSAASSSGVLNLSKIVMPRDSREESIIASLPLRLSFIVSAIV